MGCPSFFKRDFPAILEQGAYYTAATIILILRGCVRLRTRGWRDLQVDDYIGIPVLICVMAAGSMTVSSLYHGGTWLLVATPESVHKLLPCQVKNMKIGSIENVLNWYFYTTLIWGLKTMMLIFLNRLYSGFSRRLIRTVAILCSVAVLVAYILITFSCHPIYKNWQVRPLPPNRCMLRKINIYSISGLNAATDLAIMIIPFPLLWTVQVPLYKKIALGFLLCSGILIVAMSLLRIGFLGVGSLGSISLWGSREVLFATLVVNLPILRPVLNKKFWRKGYGKATPHLPYTHAPDPVRVPAGLAANALGGVQLEPDYDDDDGLPYICCVDDTDRAMEMSAIAKRKDSVAATTHTELSRQGTLHGPIGETLLEEVPVPTTPTSPPRRHSFDFDLERNASGATDVDASRRSFESLPSSPGRLPSWPLQSPERLVHHERSDH